MKTNTIVIDKNVEKAKLGQLLDVNKSVNSIPLDQLVPYIKNPEDYEVIIKNSHLLYDGQMLEFNGYAIKQIIDAADKLDLTLETGHRYADLMINHQAMVSFPSEVTWLCNNENALNDLEKNLVWGLQEPNIKMDKDKAQETSDEILKNIRKSEEKYEFWSTLSQRFSSNKLLDTLINWSIEIALRARIKHMSGITPIIDKWTDSSIDYSHNMNIEYVNFIDKRLALGMNSIKYYYTLAINASMFPDDEFHENANLIKVLRNTREAINSQRFDGIHFTIRNLKDISKKPGRARTVAKFVSELDNIASDAALPAWCSRCGLIGLFMMDMGIEFNSYFINMNIGDSYMKFARKTKSPISNHGKILDPDSCEFYNYSQACKMPFGLNGDEKAPFYRKSISKPRNIEAMNRLNKQWLDNIRSGDTTPGKEYLNRFQPDSLDTWGQV